MIGFDDFLKVDMRVGKVVAVEDFPRAHKPSYKAQVDFGPEIGARWTSAQAKLTWILVLLSRPQVPHRR